MSSLKQTGNQDDRRGSTRINRFASGSGKAKILSSVYNERKKKLDDFSRMLQDSCDQIIRRFVADALKYKPDDVLDFASRWIARERGVTLEEVEKEVFQQVIEQGMEASEEELEHEEHSDLEMQDDLNQGKPEGVFDEEGNVLNYEIETEETELKFNLESISDENGEEAEQEYKYSEMRIRAARRVNMAFALKHLSVEDRTRIVLACKEQAFAANSRVIQQGEPGTDYYLVEEGQFKCLRKYEGDEDEMELKEYVPGDCFGELALLTDDKRAASIEAAVDSKVFVVPGSLYKELVRDRVLHNREQFLDVVKNSGVFRGLILYERRCLCDALQELDFDEGEYVFKENEPPKGIYLVRKGLVVCNLPDGDLRRFGEDGFFGAADILKKRDRTAIAKVIIPTTLLFLDLNSFKRILPLVEMEIEDYLLENLV